MIERDVLFFGGGGGGGGVGCVVVSMSLSFKLRQNEFSLKPSLMYLCAMCTFVTQISPS